MITTAQAVDYSRFYDREAATLASSGVEVTMIGLPPYGPVSTVPGVSINPIALPSGFRKTLALRSIHQLAEKIRADVYHCFDPWALKVGLCMKRRSGNVKVVYDSSELFPALYRDRTDLAWPVRIAASAAIRVIERRAVREADAIIETNGTRAERFRRLGRNPVLVRNYPPRPTSPLVNRPHSGRIVWTGLICYERGFDVLLKAFARVAPRHRRARLVTFGRFDPKSNIGAWADEFVRQSSLVDRVEFRQPVPYTNLLAELENCDIGVILLQPDRLNDYTGQPNKLYEFMGAGLPIVASDFPEIASVINTTGCGITVDPTSPTEVSRALSLLLTEPDRAASLGRQGRTAVESRYNWNAAAGRLVAVYELLGGPGNGRRRRR